MALNAQKVPLPLFSKLFFIFQQLGLVRTSGRLQAKDLERKRIEEEKKQRQDEEREREMERLKSMGVPMQMNGETKKQLVSFFFLLSLFTVYLRSRENSISKISDPRRTTTPERSSSC